MYCSALTEPPQANDWFLGHPNRCLPETPAVHWHAGQRGNITLHTTQNPRHSFPLETKPANTGGEMGQAVRR